MTVLRASDGELTALGRMLRSVGLGRMAYRLWHQPMNYWRRMRLPSEPYRGSLFGFEFSGPPPRANPTTEALYRRGVWEPTTTEATIAALKPGLCVVNVGADLGYYALLAAAKNPTGCVLAFEPNSINKEHLDRNVEANRLQAVKVVRAALGNVQGSVFLRRSDARVESGRPGDEEGEWVPQYRFDELPASEDIAGRPPVGLVVIDVEGAELEVLRGMERMLERERPDVMVELHGPLLPHFGATKAEAIEWMQSKGYVPRWIDGEALVDDGFSHVLFTPLASSPAADGIG